MSEKYLDRPQDDNTRQAHPAFWRGKNTGILEMLDIIKNIVEEKDTGEGQIASPVIESARRAIIIYRDTLIKASTKSTYLAKQAKSALQESKKQVENIKL